MFFEKHGVKLGFMSVFVKAAAYALQVGWRSGAPAFLGPHMELPRSCKWKLAASELGRWGRTPCKWEYRHERALVGWVKPQCKGRSVQCAKR